ncbi:Uma2 family endonuclease [Methylotuvimicrobium sp. KM2]|uniref:Uma2 family endonuclease n=1 Tax=Methylotuvimicrobium sp. KM2 TaxID=3133976 RepID=UPI0031013C73
MDLPQLKPATYQDLCAVPDNMIAEIIGGALYTQPRPSPRHARASSSLGDEIVSPFDKGRGGPGGWWILDEPECHLGFDILVPDLAGWRREHLPRLPEGAYFELAPDWVCEVLSSGTARIDRVEKMPIYAREGVAHVWLIDPVLRILEVFENTESGWLLLGVFENDDAISIAPFDAITFNLSVLWVD